VKVICEALSHIVSFVPIFSTSFSSSIATIATIASKRLSEVLKALTSLSLLILEEEDAFVELLIIEFILSSTSLVISVAIKRLFLLAVKPDVLVLQEET